MKRNLLIAAFILTGTLLSGCGGGGYVMAYGPPAPRYGAVGYAPGPGFVWTEGYWNYTGHDWSWVGGRWQRPPRPHATWVTPEWRHEGGRYRFHRGYWR